MRVMVIMKASPESEAGVMPSQETFDAMRAFSEEMVNAGVLLAAEGLKPTSQGYRVRISGKERTVIDGPFAETKELIGGYWLLQVKSIEEAIEWVKRCPNPTPSADSEIEIRQFWEMEDLGEDFTPELREWHDRMEAKAAQQQKA